VTYRDQQRLTDIASAIAAIRSHLLHIRQQRRPGGEPGQLKTGSSRRDVPADDIVLESLAAQVRRFPRGDRLVFSSNSRGPLTNAIARTMRQVVPHVYPVCTEMRSQ